MISLSSTFDASATDPHNSYGSSKGVCSFSQDFRESYKIFHYMTVLVSVSTRLHEKSKCKYRRMQSDTTDKMPAKQTRPNRK